MEKFQELENFLTRAGVVVRGCGSFYGRTQVIEVVSYLKDRAMVQLDLLLYVRTDSKPWWGLTYSVLEKLNASGREWWFVILRGNGEEGFVVTHKQVAHMLNGLSRGEGQYHVHEKDVKAARALEFTTLHRLYQRLTSQN
jgi:hypothetical protein